MASGASFSSTNDSITIQNSQDPQHPLLTINLSNITKLSSINYLTWSLQIRSLLESYDLHHFIDDTHSPPPPTVTVTGVASPNLAYTTWKRQDCLIFSVFLGAISVSLQSLISCTTTSLDAWQTLANTYAKSSHSHIKQLKEQLKRCTKGSKSISEYMQAIKTRANELALLMMMILLIRFLKDLVMSTNSSLMQLMPVTRQFLLLSSMRNFSTKKHIFRPLNHLLYHYQQR